MEKVIVYKVGDQYFEDETAAINYEKTLNNVVDKTTQFEFNINDVVYICTRGKMRQCVVAKEEIKFEIEWNNATQDSQTVKTNYLILIDLNDESEEEIAVFDEFQASQVKYHWTELCSFPVFDNLYS